MKAPNSTVIILPLLHVPPIPMRMKGYVIAEHILLRIPKIVCE